MPHIAIVVVYTTPSLVFCFRAMTIFGCFPGLPKHTWREHQISPYTIDQHQISHIPARKRPGGPGYRYTWLPQGFGHILFRPTRLFETDPPEAQQLLRKHRAHLSVSPKRVRILNATKKHMLQPIENKK